MLHLAEHSMKSAASICVAKSSPCNATIKDVEIANLNLAIFVDANVLFWMKQFSNQKHLSTIKLHKYFHKS